MRAAAAAAARLRSGASSSWRRDRSRPTRPRAAPPLRRASPIRLAAPSPCRPRRSRRVSRE
eukprot:4685071-Prymnesium_polylepis.1